MGSVEEVVGEDAGARPGGERSGQEPVVDLVEVAGVVEQVVERWVADAHPHQPEAHAHRGHRDARLGRDRRAVAEGGDRRRPARGVEAVALVGALQLVADDRARAQRHEPVWALVAHPHQLAAQSGDEPPLPEQPDPERRAVGQVGLDCDRVPEGAQRGVRVGQQLRHPCTSFDRLAPRRRRTDSTGTS
jgi:hypothetical protein